MDLRILKDLACEIAELRILKNLAKPTADSSQLTVEEEARNPRTGLRPMRGTKVGASLIPEEILGRRAPPPSVARERVRKQLIVEGLQFSIVDKECGSP